MNLRPARPVDVTGIEAMLAPPIALGAVMPRSVDPDDFVFFM